MYQVHLIYLVKICQVHAELSVDVYNKSDNERSDEHVE